MTIFIVQATDFAHGLFAADLQPRQGNSVKEAFALAFSGAAQNPMLQPTYIVPIIPGGDVEKKGWEALWAATESYVTANNCTEEAPLAIRVQVNPVARMVIENDRVIATVWTTPSP